MHSITPYNGALTRALVSRLTDFLGESAWHVRGPGWGVPEFGIQ